MAISMYRASVPVFRRALHNLDAVLHKGEAWAQEKGVDPQVLLQSRLIADMLPLVRQVQIAADMAKNGSARLAGVEPQPFADEETTFDQLHARIARVLEYIAGFDAARIDGSEERQITLMQRSGEMKFSGQDYLTGFVLPNLYFHSTVAYAILREAGVALGKADFMGPPTAAG